MIRVAVPGLADAVARLARLGDTVRLPAAEWLAARGRVGPSDPGEWRAWVLADAGLGPDVLERFPAGPCAAADALGQWPSGRWARAEPVHLLTALDHLQLAAPVPVPLVRDESDALLATLNGHLAGSGFAVRSHPGGGWVCECPPTLECDTVEPSSALGRNLRETLPTGPDARRVGSLVNEMQMLLHEHPVNERRIARGLPPVNSVWLWGVGTARAATGSVTGVLHTDDAWLAALWRLHGGRVRPLDPAVAAVDPDGGDVRVAIASVPGQSDGVEALRAIDERCLAPVRAALLAGRCDRVLLHAGCRTFDVRRGARWAIWRRARPLAEVLA